MLFKTLSNKLGIVIKQVVTGAGLVAVTAATGLVVYNIMSSGNSSNAINAARNNGYTNIQYGAGTQVGSGGITTGSLDAAAQAAGQSGYAVSVPKKPNGAAGGAGGPAGGQNWSPTNNPGAAATDPGQAAGGLLEGIGAQAKQQKDAQSDLFGSLNQQLANAQKAGADAQAAQAPKLKDFGGTTGAGPAAHGSNVTYNPNAANGAAGGSGQQDAAVRLAQQKAKDLQASLAKTQGGRLTGMGGGNNALNGGAAAGPKEGMEITGAGAQAAAIRASLAKAPAAVQSTFIGDTYMNAGENPGSVSGIDFNGAQASTGGSGPTAAPTVGQIAKAKPHQKNYEDTIDPEQARIDLVKARANKAWAIFAVAMLGGIALATILSLTQATDSVPVIGGFTKAGRIAAALIGIAAMGVAIYAVTKSYGDGAEIPAWQKWVMGLLMGVVSVMIGMAAIGGNFVTTALQHLGKLVIGLFAHSLGALLGSTVGVTVVGQSVNYMTKGTKAEKAAYDSALKKNNDQIK